MKAFLSILLVAVILVFGALALAEERPIVEIDYGKIASEHAYSVMTSEETFNAYEKVLKETLDVDLISLESTVMVVGQDDGRPEVVVIVVGIQVNFKVKDNEGKPREAAQSMLVMLGIRKSDSVLFAGQVINATPIAISHD